MSPVGAAQAHAAALAGLPGMTPSRLARILDGFCPATALTAVRAGAHPADRNRRFAEDAARVDVGEVARRHAREGVAVLLPDLPGYPAPLVGDPGAPAVLFASGDPGVVDGRPRVAIVGTRSPTPYGCQVASELARDLSAEGVTVVSGLAHGIDGAAHAGVVRGSTDGGAPPVAVVGTGLDIVYPPANRELWGQVAARGVVFSESGLGTKPHPGVFPARNRIIAALSHVVVVVESHHRGGSLYTAEAAARRSIPVCAVPGSVRSRASDGTNGLLVDGCAPVRDAADVLVALSLAGAAGFTRRHGTSAAPASRCAGRGSATGAVPSLTAAQHAVLQAVEEIPTAFETILVRSGLSIAATAEACERLAERGLLAEGAGWWSKRH